MIRGLFQKHGDPMMISTERCPDGRRTYGFISPLGQTSVDGLHSASPLGMVSNDRFLLLIPGDALNENEHLQSVEHGGFHYRVLRLDRIGAQGCGYEGHIEAVVRREGRISENA